MLTRKNETMIDEHMLDREEAEQFIACMKEEKTRHERAKVDAQVHANRANTKVEALFWTFGVTRHEDDISMIQKTIEYLLKKWFTEV